jgi:hypothetical protein
MSANIPAKSYEWISQNQGRTEVRVHLEDGSHFVLSETEAKKQLGISLKDQAPSKQS